MLSALLYYTIIYPLSLLPYFVLYRLSDLFYILLYHGIGYRKKVVRNNLHYAFPERTRSELRGIERRFYRHLCDLVVESLKNFSISASAVRERMTHQGYEAMDAYAAAGQRVIIAGGHFANWELWGVSAAPVLKHKVVGIYKPLSNRFFDKKMRESRGKFGLGLLSTKETADYFRKPASEPDAVVFAFDQSPSNPEKAVWVRFLGRDTAALYGTEKYASESQIPVFFGKISKLSRGHYTVEYQPVDMAPHLRPKGALTQQLHDMLESQIMEQPELWLWSHRKWKHRRDGESLKFG
jgi:Kdo2-lipid IVA lauroyltransferase/acyltransferase